MCDYRLPAWKIKQLKKFHKTLKQKHEAYCVNAVVLLGTGYTPQQVAEILLISEGSVRNYWNDFKQFGKDELNKRDYTGRESLSTFARYSTLYRKEIQYHLQMERTNRYSSSTQFHLSQTEAGAK